jgi:hypothetical protein
MAKRRPMSFHACGEPWEVCECPNLVSAREEIMPVDWGKWLKETRLEFDRKWSLTASSTET